MKNQRLLGVWIIVGAVLVIGVLAIGNNNDSVDTDVAVDADNPLASIDDTPTTSTVENDAPSTTAAPTTTAPPTTVAPTTTIAPDGQALPTSPAELAVR